MVKKSKQIFGLLGRNIEYSFSRAYFNEKFFSLGLSDYSYQNFDLQNLTNISEKCKRTQCYNTIQKRNHGLFGLY